jgi:Cu(I)/Ag(I) efflux system membrane fusion protein
MKKQIIIIIILAFAGGLFFSKILSKRGNTEAIIAKDQKKTNILYYRNPMSPTIVSKTPAKDNMGMDYIPVYDEGGDPNSSNVPGRSGFNLPKENQQIIGVTTTKVLRRPLNSEIRANGSVAFDPDLFSAISEYRQAVVGKISIKDNSFSELKDDANQLVEASRTRLRLLGLTDGQIKSLVVTKANPMNLLLPKGHAWIYAEVYEYEASGVKIGQEIEVTSPTTPGKTFKGKISSISPIINPTTRTVRVRGLVPDPDGALRPDSYVDVKIKSALGEKLSVPEDSVLHTGEHDFVFLVKHEGSFEPTEVKVGSKTHDYYEILSGLSEGDTVVTGAQFLIDSESRLRGALQTIKPSSETSTPSPLKDKKNESEDQ